MNPMLPTLDELFGTPAKDEKDEAKADDEDEAEAKLEQRRANYICSIQSNWPRDWKADQLAAAFGNNGIHVVEGLPTVYPRYEDNTFFCP